MTAVYLFTGLLVLLLVLGLVVGPLLERGPVPGEGDAPPEARRDAELEALQEVEFEYETGKLSEEDYRELRSRHARAAVEARREARAGGGDGSGERGEGSGEAGAAAGEGGGTTGGRASGRREAPAGTGRGAAAGSGASDAGAEGAAEAGAEVEGAESGGGGVSAETPEEGPTPLSCDSCGASARPEASYCTSCGARLANRESGGSGEGARDSPS